MFRKLAAVLLIALALATLGLYARAIMSPLTVSIGSGAVTLVQSGAVTRSYGQAPAALAAPSTAGTALVFLAATSAATQPTTMPAGWVRQSTVSSNGGAYIFEVWLYLNNPGGITAATLKDAGAGTPFWTAQISEWANVRGASAVDASGTLANQVLDKVLAPTTTTAVQSVGDVAISAWYQQTNVGAVVFTSPSGFTRLADNGSDATIATHMDAEYQIGPAVGSVLGPTLTCDTTTNVNKAGAIIVLKAAPPVTDQTAMLAY